MYSVIQLTQGLQKYSILPRPPHASPCLGTIIQNVLYFLLSRHYTYIQEYHIHAT